MPTHVAALHGIAWPGVWKLLREFYTDGVPRLKVFIATHDQLGDGDTCSNRVLLDDEIFGDRQQMSKHDFTYYREFGAELVLPESFRNGPFATDNPANADFVLVDACIMGKGQQGQYQKDVLKWLQEASPTAAIFANTPEKIVLTLTGDHGRCHNYKERLGKGWPQSSTAESVHANRIITPEFWPVTTLQHDGSKARFSCYNRSTSATVPTAASSFPIEKLVCTEPRV
jgi:hypothetical protein